MLNGRNILLVLATRYKGNWDEIYNAVKRKEKVTEEEVNETLENLNCNFVTLIDDNYPTYLERVYKPPFVLFYYGNFDLIADNTNLLTFISTSNIDSNNETALNSILNDVDSKYTYVCNSHTRASLIALTRNEKSVLVLDNGIYNPPKGAEVLYRNIKENGGLVISEYPNNVVNKETSILSLKLSSKAIGVEIKLVPNLTHLEIGYAVNNNLGIYIIPQLVNSETYNNQLIKDGANLIDNGSDLDVD